MTSRSRFIDNEAGVSDDEDADESFDIEKVARQARKRRADRKELASAAVAVDSDETREEEEKLAQVAKCFKGGVIPDVLKGCDFMNFSEPRAVTQHLTRPALGELRKALRLLRIQEILQNLEDAQEQKLNSHIYSFLVNFATFYREWEETKSAAKDLQYENAWNFFHEFLRDFVDKVSASDNYNGAAELGLSRAWVAFSALCDVAVTDRSFPAPNKFEFRCIHGMQTRDEKEALWRITFNEEKKTMDANLFWVVDKSSVPEVGTMNTFKLKELKDMLADLIIRGDVKAWKKRHGGLSNIDFLLVQIIGYGVLALGMKSSLKYNLQPQLARKAKGDEDEEEEDDEDEEGDEEDRDFIAPEDDEEEEDGDEGEEDEDEEEEEQKPKQKKPLSRLKRHHEAPSGKEEKPKPESKEKSEPEEPATKKARQDDSELKANSKE